ncbi:hypothetical protein [Psychrobacter sp. 16-MNA-CIBAN-0192]|uniref:hypothetical protein n=1 Tax=Psychrobacter sp. 16-MNA-CIBAN-0192 TaxID=3140448 RepID=UPI003329A674
MRYDDDEYNCLHFAVDIYRDITGKDMGIYVGELLTGRKKRKINTDKLKEFKQLKAPSDPCLVIMHGAELHTGIYHQDKIMHFNDLGVHCAAPHIAESRYGRITYYAI